MANEQRQQQRGKRSGADMAHADGRAAFGKAADRDAVPSGYRVAKGLAEAWRAGWDEAAAEAQAAREALVRVQEPVVRTQEPEVATRLGSGLGSGGPPKCPSCGRTTLANKLSWAVIVSTRAVGVDYLECRGCGHRYERRAQSRGACSGQ